MSCFTERVLYLLLCIGTHFYTSFKGKGEIAGGSSRSTWSREVGRAYKVRSWL